MQCCLIFQFTGRNNYTIMGAGHGGLMVSNAELQIELSGFVPWPGTLCCVFGQDTLLSQCLSPPRPQFF